MHFLLAQNLFPENAVGEAETQTFIISFIVIRMAENPFLREVANMTSSNPKRRAASLDHLVCQLPDAMCCHFLKGKRAIMGELCRIRDGEPDRCFGVADGYESILRSNLLRGTGERRLGIDSGSDDCISEGDLSSPDVDGIGRLRHDNQSKNQQSRHYHSEIQRMRG